MTRRRWRPVEQLVLCPYCGYHADRASEVHDDGSAPKDGDFSMCISCGNFSVFEAKLAEGLRRPTMHEKTLISTDADCFAAWVAWREVVERKGPPQ